MANAASRSACSCCFEPVPACVDTLLIEDGKILLEKRHSGKYAGCWGVPGGHLEVGESAIEGLMREVLEETGLRVSVGPLVGIYSGRRYHGARTVSICFFSKRKGGKLKLQREEVDEVRFFSPGKLPKKIAFDHRKMILDGFEILAGKKKAPLVR